MYDPTYGTDLANQTAQATQTQPQSSSAVSAIPTPNVNSTASLPTTIGSTLANAQRVLSNINQPQTNNPPAAKQESLWERLLPTLGGCRCGNGRNGTGPSTGGLSLAIPVLSAIFGGAAGRAGENAATGKKIVQGNDVVSGLEQGAGQLAGMGIAKAIGAGGNILANYGASKGAQAASAAKDVADFSPYENVAKGSDLKGMKDLFNNQLGTDDISPSNVHNITNMLTGGGANDTPDFINATKNQLVDGAGEVDTSGISNVLKGSINNESNISALGDATVKGTAGNDLYNSLIDKTSSLYGMEGPETAANGTIDTLVKPTAVQDAIQSTRDALDNVNINTPTGQATKNVLTDYRAALTKALGETSGLNDTIKAYTVPAEDEAAFRAAVANAGLPSQVADYGINAVNNAKNYTDLTSAEVPLVKAGKLADAADTYNAGPGVIKGAKVAAKSSLLNNPLRLAADAAGLYGVVKGKPQDAIPAALLALGGSPGAMSGLGGLISSIGSTAGQGALGAIGNVIAGSPNDVTGPAGAGTQLTMPTTTNGANMNLGNSTLGQALQQDLTAGRTALAAPGSASGFAPQISQLTTLLPIMQKLAAAEQAAQNLQQYQNKAGGAQGLIPGTLAKLGSSFTGGPAAGYGAQQKQAQQLIGNALNIQPGAVATPGITQTQPAAQQTLQSLLSQILAYANGSPSAIPAQ